MVLPVYSYGIFSMTVRHCFMLVRHNLYMAPFPLWYFSYDCTSLLPCSYGITCVCPPYPFYSRSHAVLTCDLSMLVQKTFLGPLTLSSHGHRRASMIAGYVDAIIGIRHRLQTSNYDSTLLIPLKTITRYVQDYRYHILHDWLSPMVLPH